MTDPATSSTKQLNRVFLISAATDILAGLVLAVLGLDKDEQVLTIVGVALAIGGTAVLSWLIVRTSRPELL